MRAALLTILLLLLASAAQAWDGPGWSPWSLSVQERRDGLSYNSQLTFTRQGRVWKVQGSCTVHDPSNGAWLTQKGSGIARRSEQGLRADVERLDGFYVDEERIIWGTMLCGSGEYHMGTAD